MTSPHDGSSEDGLPGEGRPDDSPFDEAYDEEPALVGPAASGSFPQARSIRRYTAAVARQRSDAAIGDLLGDVYYALITTAIGVGVALGVAGQLRASLPPAPTVVASTGTSLPMIVAAAVVALGGIMLSLAGRLGPVGMGGAEATWWLGLPVDRRGLLRPTASRLPLVLAVIGGVVVGILDAGLLAEQDLGRLARTIMTAALGSAVVVLGAGLAQTWSVSRRATAALGDVVLVAAPLLAGGAALTGWYVHELPTAPAWLIVVLAAAVAGMVVLLDVRLERIPERSLRESGSVATQAVGAVVSLDTRELGRALTDGAAASRRRHSLRLRVVRGPSSALVTADALVLVRSLRHLVQLVVAALVPALVVSVPQLAGPLGVCLGLVIAGYVAMSATSEGARRAEKSPVLDRLLPLSAKQVRRLRMVVPAVAMALWSLAAFAAVGHWAGDAPGWLLLGLASTPVWAGAAVRSAYRPAPDWAGPLVSTPMGALPTGVGSVLARGPDVVVLGMIPVIIAVVLGQVNTTLLVVQAVASVIAVAVGSSTSTKTMMDRLASATDSAQGGAAGAGAAATKPRAAAGTGAKAASTKTAPAKSAPRGGSAGGAKRPAGGQPGAGSARRKPRKPPGGGGGTGGRP